MKLIFKVIAPLTLSLTAYAQDKNNFDFENIVGGLPAKWMVTPTQGYAVSIDSTIVHSGKYSMMVESKSDVKDRSLQSIIFTLPENYDGRFIHLSGWIKTEGVRDGYAGLAIHIAPLGLVDDMKQRGIIGTTDWRRYEITLPLKAADTKQIYIGGVLKGRGRVWFDDFSVTIDGVEMSNAKTYERILLPAEKDHEFDRGSDVAFPVLTEKRIADLEQLGKMWGYLKYHHPFIAAGNVNWDYELFRFLPKYLSAKRPAKVLTDWVNSFGPIDVAIIENFYVEMFKGLGNPHFKNENPYKNMPYPDAGFRLLSLFRLWSSVEYFCPGRNLTEKPWSGILKDYIPAFVGAKNELEYEIAALRVIGEICDTHANLRGAADKIDSLRGNYYAPYRMQFVENRLVVTDYLDIGKCTFKKGDIINTINGRKVSQIVDSLKPYYPASNEAERLRDIAPNILRSRNNTILVDGEPMRLYHKDSIDLHSFYRVSASEKSYKILDGNIGYITLASIKDEDVPTIKQELQDTKGLIIDIRNYPSAFMPFALGSWFVAEQTPFVKFTQGSVSSPGEFLMGEPECIMPKPTVPTYRGKVVVLVNDMSQSQAEYTAMAFRAGANAAVVGSQTAGADGDVSTIILPGGLSTWISGLGVFYPDGTPTQRVGIVPDIEVRPTIEGIRAGRDELMEKAIEIISRW